MTKIQKFDHSLNVGEKWNSEAAKQSTATEILFLV